LRGALIEVGWWRPASLYSAAEECEMSDTLWKWEQLRAGVVYNRVMFNTQDEAERFAAQMGRVEPDLTWRIEPVPAKMVWN
jgi:hypothetical protein